MLNIIKLLSAFIIAVAYAAPFNANASQNNSVSCSVVVDGSEPYQANFTVQPGVEFFDDFGNNIRFKDFTATTQTANGTTTVTIDYFADVSVFNSIEFGATLTLPTSGRGSASTNGRTGFSSSSGNGTASYTLTCRRA
jgi:hypothetical protein